MRWFPSVLLMFFPTIALAWLPNGVQLTGASDDQMAPKIVSDGAGGAFVGWHDFRDYFPPPGLRTECYIQRVTAAGQIAPGWPADGLLVGTGPGHQFPAALLSDGSGGLLIVYGDTRIDFGDLYLQRITAAGAVAPGWPAAGVPIAVGPGQQDSPEMVGDGEGGAFVSWQETDNPLNPNIGGTRARYAHILARGQLAPAWPENGRLFEPTALIVNRPLLLASEGGGFLACWSAIADAAYASARVSAARYLPDGSEDPAWPAGGVTICSQRSFPVVRLVGDGARGFFTLLDDYRNSPPGSPFAEEDLYAQHVLGSGAVAPGWPADALPVSARAGVPEQSPSLCEDGRGGVFFAWEDYRSNYARVFGQHLNADAQPYAGWPVEGLSLSDRFAFQLSPQLAWDGMNGAYLTWMNLETGGYRSYVQHLMASGAAAPGWPSGGLPVIPLPTDQYVPMITSDGLGGAIVAWEDIRTGGVRDIYAQRYLTSGVVAAQVSLAGAEATPEEVRVRWQVSGEMRASVERREIGSAAEGEWRVLSELVADGSGYMSFTDREVTPGIRYGYRLAFASGARGGETSIEVPVSLSLALEGARPNPAAGVLWVSLTLPDAAVARLALYDLAGRQVAAREVGTRGAGRHLVRLDDGALAPGVYWAALTQGIRTLRTRVAVVR